jgi:site-specific recombinase
MLSDLRNALHPSQQEDPLLPPLAGLLKAFAEATDSAERLERWVDLLDWTREGAHVHAQGDDEGAQLASGDTVRLRLLLHVLESCSPVRLSIQAAVAALFAGADASSLITEAGMPSERGFLGEASSRLWSKLLPEPTDTPDMRQFLRRCYRTRAQVSRFQRWPPELFHRIVVVVMPPADSQTWVTLRRSVTDAVHLLCIRVKSQGLSPILRSRSHEVPVTESPFFKLANATAELLAERDRSATQVGKETPDDGAELTAWQQAIADCRAELAEIERQIQDEGVSIDIVFSLDLLDRCLTRLELLGEILLTLPGRERSALVQRLLTRLVYHLYQSRSLRDLAGTNLRLLYRRIVERSGETGEHYIARDRGEYHHLLLAAAGGGVVMVATTALKLYATDIPGSAFLHGVIYGVIYAVSFLILHHLHLVLATKQPAMTAATVATILREQRGAGRIDEIVDHIARICHSQLAAAIGNVVMVGLGALAFTTIWQLVFGHAFLSQETAQRTHESLDPLSTGTVFFAALTGVLLWLSSVIGGWIDNWSAWHRIHRGIADHPLGKTIGRERMIRWGKTWRRHIAAWGANISLGIMLGMVPAVGYFIGLPLEMRHVTLSTGLLFTACGSLEGEWYSATWFALAVSGIISMFVLNLSVSFALSLWTALRALEVPAGDVRELLRRLAWRMVTRPFDFILPPWTARRARDL